ncbi:MAG: hypothetical protein C4523_08895 [Myxococcales bacterium]|nr:MAG: hypothetical protein C4523_08895 [Myxococcales bacterium]
MNAKRNLDLICMTWAAEGGFTDSDMKPITDALAVLQNDGLYALFLFLKARNNEKLQKKLIELGEEQKLGLWSCRGSDILSELRKMMDVPNDKSKGGLNSIFFAIDHITKALTYARFHAKAENKK